eukprot:CAMPEP_0180138830 /NCGR_PEP_ID=MMETSP0986-20121125/13145_1 /TAXON_ID=697907 /ORGANISM="non described non described, Strain CCMP2293" /LENGTH=213 /DNA_ID=CAMNT_0022080765 /DNA_START=171 /DNA_END=816 /DNA_ORIENTATION=+
MSHSLLLLLAVSFRARECVLGVGDGDGDALLVHVHPIVAQIAVLVDSAVHSDDGEAVAHLARHGVDPAALELCHPPRFPFAAPVRLPAVPLRLLVEVDVVDAAAPLAFVLQRHRRPADAVDRHVAREADRVGGLILALGAPEPDEPRVVTRAEDLFDVFRLRGQAEVDHPALPLALSDYTRSTKSSPAAVRTAVAEILASSAALAPGPSALRP